MWCIPKITPEFRVRMYKLLDLYQIPYNPRMPLICIDEKSKQLIADTKLQLPMKPGKSKRYDYEYKRNGTVNIFVAVEPKSGKRIYKVTDYKKKADFAVFIKDIINSQYFKDVDKVQIVVDNLNTHFKKSFYDTFEKSEADKILNKVDFHYTPKHGSWLNMAEIEINALERQCLNRRIGDKSILINEVKSCENRRNEQKIKIKWFFTKQDADRKLSKYYIS